MGHWDDDAATQFLPEQELVHWLSVHNLLLLPKYRIGTSNVPEFTIDN